MLPVMLAGTQSFMPLLLCCCLCVRARQNQMESHNGFSSRRPLPLLPLFERLVSCIEPSTSKMRLEEPQETAEDCKQEGPCQTGLSLGQPKAVANLKQRQESNFSQELICWFPTYQENMTSREQSAHGATFAFQKIKSPQPMANFQSQKRLGAQGGQIM